MLVPQNDISEIPKTVESLPKVITFFGRLFYYWKSFKKLQYLRKIRRENCTSLAFLWLGLYNIRLINPVYFLAEKRFILLQKESVKDLFCEVDKRYQ